LILLLSSFFLLLVTWTERHVSPGDEKACIDKKTPGTYTYRPRPVCLQSEKETKALCDSISSGHLKWGGSGK